MLHSCVRFNCDAQEWFHFVDKEKQVRIRIDGKVDQMIAEAAELKQWTITEVLFPLSLANVTLLCLNTHCDAK